MESLVTTTEKIANNIVIHNQTLISKITPSHFSMTVYVPNLNREGKLYNSHIFWTKYFQNLFNHFFNGCEQYEIIGNYRNRDGISYQEITKVIDSDLFEFKKSYTPSQIIHIIKQHIALFAICTSQEFVKFKIDGQSYLFEINHIKK